MQTHTELKLETLTILNKAENSELYKFFSSVFLLFSFHFLIDFFVFAKIVRVRTFSVQSSNGELYRCNSTLEDQIHGCFN